MVPLWRAVGRRVTLWRASAVNARQRVNHGSVLAVLWPSLDFVVWNLFFLYIEERFQTSKSPKQAEAFKNSRKRTCCSLAPFWRSFGLPWILSFGTSSHYKKNRGSKRQNPQSKPKHSKTRLNGRVVSFEFLWDPSGARLCIPKYPV
jgi:hypothetical protein